MGAVYRARHKQLGTTIAVKVLHERFRADLQFCARFHAEALLVSQLDHPNVVRVLDYGQEPDGLLYLAMDFLEGVELQETLLRAGTLPLPRIVDIAMQVSAGLGHAHARGIIHRDVKPSNIVLVKSDDDEGEAFELVKVCDFGIAALGTTRTDEGNAAGTPEYMAPEQTTGSRVTPSADVYACGCALYEMLTGQVPFTADQAYRILMKHRNEVPRPPSSIEPTIPPALEAVILRCMEKAPERRYQSARELRVELRKIADARS
jgi:serine/threonine-protein kinase